jgi:transcriptional regulator with XRE-family HTH domain
VRSGEAVSEHDQQVGRRLAAARAKLGLSQTEVGRRMGFAQSRVAKLETGTRRLLFSEAIGFADLYGISLSDLVPRDGGGLGRHEGTERD